MIQKSHLLLKRIKEFWNNFKPVIVDFMIIGSLSFLLYWTRWRK